MQRLTDKIPSMSDEDKCDVLFSLIGIIEDNNDFGSDPDEIWLEDDNAVSVFRAKNAENLAYYPPEVIEARLAETVIDIDRRTWGWFFLGMLAYRMYYNTDYYTKQRIGVLDEPSPSRSHRAYVIQQSETGGIPFGRAVSLLTAVSPEDRQAGVAELLVYLTEHMPETAVISFICDGDTVKTEERKINRDLVLSDIDSKVSANGKSYRIVEATTIPYRPGRHSYEVRIVEDKIIAAQKSKQNDNFSLLLCVSKLYFTGNEQDINSMIALFKMDSEDHTYSLPIRASYHSCKFQVFRSGKGIRPEKIEDFTVEIPHNGTENRKLIISYRAQSRSVSIAMGERMSQPLTVYDIKA